jgi:two-component system, LytTR family, sensor kinase
LPLAKHFLIRMPASVHRPPDAIDPVRSRVWWAVFAGAWTAVALIFAVQAHFAASLRGGSRSWQDVLLQGAMDAYTWGLLALVAFWLARRLPLDGGRWRRALGPHLAVLLVLIPVRLLLLALLSSLTLSAPRAPMATWDRIMIAFPTNLHLYVLLVGVGYGLEYFRRYRERELVAARLEAQVASARLQVLTTQLQPRFLFSSLRTISALMQRDVKAADRTLALLGDLLRCTLQKRERRSVSLHDEIEFLELYLEIEQMRFGERLRVHWDVQPGALDASVPHLLLQPLVDGAIKHAISARGTCDLQISAWREGGSLVLAVGDPQPTAGEMTEGRCIPESGASAPGDRFLHLPLAAPDAGEWDFALVRARLDQLCGGAHRLEVETLDHGRRRVRISVPYEPSAQAPVSVEPQALAGLAP